MTARSWDDSLTETIERLQRALNMQAILRDHGINPTQMFIMFVLMKCGSQPSSEIAKRVGITPGAATQTYDDMVNQGWIERHRSVKDKRVVELKLTDQGIALFQSIMAARRSEMVRLLEKLGPEDGAAFIRIMERLVEILKEEGRIE